MFILYRVFLLTFNFNGYYVILTVISSTSFFFSLIDFDHQFIFNILVRLTLNNAHNKKKWQWPLKNMLCIFIDSSINFPLDIIYDEIMNEKSIWTLTISFYNYQGFLYIFIVMVAFIKLYNKLFIIARFHYNH